MSQPPSVELLESTHTFPGHFTFKVIGMADGNFVNRVIELIQKVLALPTLPVHSTRVTAGGKHVAVTTEVEIKNAEAVRQVYKEIMGLEGLVLLL